MRKYRIDKADKTALLKRYEYLIFVATERRELDDNEEIELKELQEMFCVTLGGKNGND